MNYVPQDIEPLIQEALTQLGWKANAKRLSARVSRLNLGLPREDEFSIVCSWLGRCELIHKLDQNQHPKESSNIYQVPDLLAVFKNKDQRIPTLIEVKSKKDKTLSFRPDYYEKLKKYSDLVGLPLLIAWKFHSLWILFDISHLKKAIKNWNIRFDEAMKENLLGILAGDFSYSLYPESALHLQFRKDELIEATPNDSGYTEQWKMTCDDVYYSTGKEKVVRKIPVPVQSLFTTWDLEQREEHTDSHITVSFFVPEHTILFAHMALVRLISWSLPSEQGINWRSLLAESKVIKGIDDFGDAIKDGMKYSIVHTVLHQQPNTVPSYINGT